MWLADSQPSLGLRAESTQAIKMEMQQNPSCCRKGRDLPLSSSAHFFPHPHAGLTAAPALVGSAESIRFANPAGAVQGLCLVFCWFIELKELTEELGERQADAVGEEGSGAGQPRPSSSCSNAEIHPQSLHARGVSALPSFLPHPTVWARTAKSVN